MAEDDGEMDVEGWDSDFALTAKVRVRIEENAASAVLGDNRRDVKNRSSSGLGRRRHCSLIRGLD